MPTLWLCAGRGDATRALDVLRQTRRQSSLFPQLAHSTLQNGFIGRQAPSRQVVQSARVGGFAERTACAPHPPICGETIDVNRMAAQAKKPKSRALQAKPFWLRHIGVM